MDLRLPSQETTDYWISVEAPSPYSLQEVLGKWLLFVPLAEIDAVWGKVRDAVGNGTVKAAAAKVSTMRDNPNALNSQTKVICVYTSEDMREEVGRLLMENFPEIQAMKVIRYKTDAATMAGVYANRGGNQKTTCLALYWNDGNIQFK